MSGDYTLTFDINAQCRTCGASVAARVHEGEMIPPIVHADGCAVAQREAEQRAELEARLRTAP